MDGCKKTEKPNRLHSGVSLQFCLKVSVLLRKGSNHTIPSQMLYKILYVANSTQFPLELQEEGIVSATTEVPLPVLNNRLFLGSKHKDLCRPPPPMDVDSLLDTSAVMEIPLSLIFSSLNHSLDLQSPRQKNQISQIQGMPSRPEYLKGCVFSHGLPPSLQDTLKPPN